MAESGKPADSGTGESSEPSAGTAPANDVDAWNQTGAAQAAATVPGFSAVSNADMLHLADLLQAEHDGNLDAYLKFTSDGTNTTVHVSTSGEVNWHETEIVLQGVGDLTAGGARTASAIVADLLMHGALISDM